MGDCSWLVAGWRTPSHRDPPTSHRGPPPIAQLVGPTPAASDHEAVIVGPPVGLPWALPSHSSWAPLPIMGLPTIMGRRHRKLLRVWGSCCVFGLGAACFLAGAGVFGGGPIPTPPIPTRPLAHSPIPMPPTRPSPLRPSGVFDRLFSVAWPSRRGAAAGRSRNARRAWGVGLGLSREQ
jgi:hypothetical protein